LSHLLLDLLFIIIGFIIRNVGVLSEKFGLIENGGPSKLLHIKMQDKK